MMKPDDWVTVNDQAGVVSSISPDGEQVTIRIPQVDWPFPLYIIVPRKCVKKMKHTAPSYEESPL
jgi:hypothetical protein